jgi:phospholipase/lecithinase/hemolysin/uncharacterized protein YhjY with autotransporter beta-barrel domain
MGARKLQGYAAAAIWVATLAIGATAAHAQSQFNTLTVIGDSYADNGNLAKFRVFGANAPYPSNGVPFVLQPFITYPRPLQLLLGIPDAATTNWAVGGSTSGPVGGFAGTPSFPQQVGLAIQSRGRFGPQDLITINIGGNDAGAAEGMLTSPAQAVAVATQATTNIQNGMLQLTAAGGRTFMVGTFSDLSTIVNIANSGNPALIANSRLYGQTFFQQEQQKLLPLSLAGARIFMFDFSQWGKQVAANPAAYGFATTNVPCAGTPACATAFSLGQFTNLSYDGLHLTTGGFQIVAQYMANLLAAPSTYPAQAEIAQIATTNFVNSFFGRLDAYRSAGLGFAADMPVKARPMPVEGPFAVFIEATGAVGSRETSQPDSLGFRYGLGGGQMGGEYRVNPNIRVGGIFNYSNVATDLNNSNGHIKDDVYQFGGYASFSYPHWFADFAALAGRQNLHIDRPGVISTINGSTNADSFAAAAKSAYLFDLASNIQAGPLVGLAYARSRVGGYTETGDPLLTFAVGDQTLSGLVGSAGVQVRYSYTLFDLLVRPYINATIEYDFIGSGRTILATETQALLLPILTPLNSDNRAYFKIQSGASVAMTENLSVMYNTISTYGRDHYDFGGNVGLKYRF